MGKQEYVKGKMTELRLGRILLKHGFFVIRSPASGRRTKHFIYPDLIAIKQGKVLLFEVKLRNKKDSIHIDKRKYDNYMYAAKLSGGKPYLAVYVKTEGRWYFFPFETLKFRDNKYFLSVYMYEKGESLEKILSISK